MLCSLSSAKDTGDLNIQGNKSFNVKAVYVHIGHVIKWSG